GGSGRQVRRGVVGTAGALLLEACSSIEGRRMSELDPRVPALLDRTISVDMHTHAAGAGFMREPRYDLAARMREGHMTAVCLCHSADGPVIRRVPTTGQIKQHRDPRPVELHELTERRLDCMDALLIPANGLTRVLTPADLAAAKAAGRPA